MDIYQQLGQLLTLPIIVFCVVVWFVVKYLRKAVELRKPQLKDSKIWRELALPTIPLLVGMLLMVVTKYPMPEVFPDTWVCRAFLGASCGGFSGFVYRLLKQALTKKAESAQEENSDPTASV